ncbi:hypothetical protein CY34DRAFT_800165 [Suillus luteus UH-Slu-Lm8-n1]|uniref:Uncharacterized protein n=1 Tax=Suillus luteus UH-Slu-Lm8-n1 TaxID=930992 RepID=A0A0D0BL06_9AGAM|nr:hypothetical protein CY34DRAFT_800165 [Suillus luteus UH-Slu-Lm8-n1]
MNYFTIPTVRPQSPPSKLNFIPRSTRSGPGHRSTKMTQIVLQYGALRHLHLGIIEPPKANVRSAPQHASIPY